MGRANFAVALSTLIAVVWAVSLSGTAHPHFQPSLVSQSKVSSSYPANNLSVKFRDTREHGLLIDAWINGAGPFAFALDTGAGISIVGQRIVREAQLHVYPSGHRLVGGLSTSPILANEETLLGQLSLGFPDNAIANHVNAAVARVLPQGIDGILDPSDLSSYGYSIDLPNHILEVFGREQVRLHESDVSSAGTIVRWARERDSRRPFVKLGDGRLALIDTGSSLGLAVSDGEIYGSNHRSNARVVRDLGGGTIRSQRVAPTTVTIGSLVLRGVPTDVLTGGALGAPVILGREALYPFKITFDPRARLIEIEPVNER